MQASVQTQRRKKVELPQVTPTALPEVEQQNQKQRQRKIKKLTMINRELIDTLKRQNDELTRKINRQKLKVGRSVERTQRTDSPVSNLEKQKKQLANAYKQIEMYKTVLKDLKAKQISTQSIEKLNQLQNQIKFEDAVIDKLQKQLKYVKNIKEQQEKELHLYENQDVKASVGELEQELRKLKEQLKQAKRQAKKREDYALNQHAYFIELEKTYRKHNDQYYPGITPTKPNTNQLQQQGQDIVNDKEWQTMRQQLAELKKIHEDSNKKIEQLTRQRNKELKAAQQNEERLAEKQRKLQALRSKMAELAKLVGSDKEDNQTSQTKRNQQTENDETGRYEAVMQNGKRVFKPKDAANEREVKRWVVPQAYSQQRGKILPDSTFFSDKSYLRNTRKSKIDKMQVWTNSAGVPLAFQAHYAAEDGRRIEGILAHSLGELQELEDRVVQFKEGDYLAKIQGTFQQGLLSGLTLISKFGKKQVFNPTATGQQFRFDPRPNEIPTCLFGASVRDYNNLIRICHIGCEFIADW